MQAPRFSEGFKEQAVRQAADRGDFVAKCSAGTGVSAASLTVTGGVSLDTSDDSKRFWCEHDLQTSVHRRGNCCTSVVPESFFSSLTEKLLREPTTKTREMSRAEPFDNIELFNECLLLLSHMVGISLERFERADAGDKNF